MNEIPGLWYSKMYYTEVILFKKFLISKEQICLQCNSIIFNYQGIDPEASGLCS